MSIKIQNLWVSADGVQSCIGDFIIRIGNLTTLVCKVSVLLGTNSSKRSIQNSLYFAKCLLCSWCFQKVHNASTYDVRSLFEMSQLTHLIPSISGGDFTCKLFDSFTPFTVVIIYILYRHFEKITIIKPFTSRPANSERYFALGFCISIRNFLCLVHSGTSLPKCWMEKKRSPLQIRLSTLTIQSRTVSSGSSTTVS